MNRRCFLLGVVGALVPGDRVYLIGDSQAFLLQYDLAPLAKADGVPFGTAAIGGSSIISWAQGHDRELALMRRFYPTVLVVALGSNDAYMGPRIVANEPPYLRRLLGRLRGRVVWVGPPDLPRARKGLEAVASMVKKEGVDYLDSRQVRLAMWDDQLHCARPHPDGCSKWARWVWSYLKDSTP